MMGGEGVTGNSDIGIVDVNGMICGIDGDGVTGSIIMGVGGGGSMEVDDEGILLSIGII